MSYLIILFRNSYVQFSNVAAKVVRRCIQDNLKKEALKREEAFAKVNKWEAGKLAPKSNYVLVIFLI